jgi:hypothetical protein
MNRFALIAAASCMLIISAAPVHAQVDLNFFKHSAVEKYLNPVVGKGAEYQSIEKESSGEKTRSTMIGIVGKDTFEGKDAFWMEVVSNSDGQSALAKMLITRDDFGFHKMIIQPTGQQAMEMPFNPGKDAHQEKIEEKFKDWHSVGTEPVTVPAGTFVCEHLHNDKTNSDLWASDKVTPFGMIKQVDGKQTMVLMKLIPDFQDRITGPVKQFDPQAFRQQMMQKHDPNQ